MLRADSELDPAVNRSIVEPTRVAVTVTFAVGAMLVAGDRLRNMASRIVRQATRR